MSIAPPPPPKRTSASAPTSRPLTPEASPGWKGKMKARGSAWGKVAMEKGVKLSDNIGGRVNSVAEKRFGTEAFWPTTGDFPKEMDKAARILRAFTVDGVVTEEKIAEGSDGDKKKKSRKVLRKIPPAVIKEAKGLAIFTSMRSGIAPLGGAGGAGIVVAKLPDGTWSGPASISPNNLSTGFLIGVDVYDCVLVIRSQKALDSFATHKATLGTEIGVTAGPYGAGAAVEAGRERAPVFSYVRSRGMYAGVEVVGQVFVERFDENAAMYHWPGIKAGDILSGKVRVPVEAVNLMSALKDAESGVAQRQKGDALDVVVPEGVDLLDLNDGEVLKLPPTPDMTDGHEQESDPETEKVHYPSRHGSLHSPMSPMDLPPPRRSVAAPPLPPRSSRRPAMKQHFSSQSHYSDGDEPAGPSEIELADDLPPSYADGVSGATYPVEKGVGVPAGATGDDNEPMSEAERKEWEQFLAEHHEEEKTRGAVAGENVNGLAHQLRDQKLEDAEGSLR